MNHFHTLESTAKRGVAGLDPEARNSLVEAIRCHCGPDGGHTDLSGNHSDPYYSFFAWLCLRALTGTSPVALEQYFTACRVESPIDHFCKAFVSIYRMSVFKRKFASWCFLLRHPARDPYTLFLSGLMLGISFPRLAPVLLRLARTNDILALSTSRLAAYLLTHPHASSAPLLRENLRRRHSATGGFASADNASPDLLATAVARMALSGEPLDNAHDLLFTEACWCPDDLFVSTPGLPRGDVEHTYYALLVLGTCRA